ncbi:related to FF domain [Lecanosticta acicola]|uniref:Related to FF domain n=1 Tax=Lecanosticta acicola TaxID=111012 RepID=A0AAI8Z2I9_9PEZI|nr:related to FF domain [Lecanosticta acicola]
MESPAKKLKMSSPALGTQQDFVSFGDEEGTFGSTEKDSTDQYTPFRAPKEPRLDRAHGRNGYDPRRDPRNARDKPKSRHILPGYEPWVLVRTKFRRRFVHNTQTKESFWRIPKDVMPGVIEFERWEKDGQEKAENAKWAEQQLQEMRDKSKAEEVNRDADEEGRSRRRRSESLQRDDEEALMAELAAQAEHAEEQDAKKAFTATQPLQSQIPETGLDSDSEYEVVEVTDSEGEGEGEEEEETGEAPGEPAAGQPPEDGQPEEDGPVEFGEDDIAWQLAAMGEDYGLDPGEYGDAYEKEWEEGAEGLPLSREDATHLFRDLLEDHGISPFTPWDKVIEDESETSILNDQRYTVLPNMRARKEAFDSWAKDKATRLKEERAATAKRDPKIPYLALLQDKATPKLYWPEFKRKYKKEPELNDRKLSDKDREKLYRDHIGRLKLPESTRKADLQILLKGVPLKSLNRDTQLDSLPQQLLSHLHFVSLSPNARDPIIKAHIQKLPPAPDDDDLTDEQRAEEDKKREERRRREQAMAERVRKVEEERRRADKDEDRARRDLREEERELQRAMAVSSRGLSSHFREDRANSKP